LTGVSEILVLVLLITCILILPRFFKGESTQQKPSLKKLGRIPVKIRFAIVLSLVYPAAMALYLKPWNENLIFYLSFAILPVILFWAFAWILAGLKK
jgi:hypothetical protein